MTYLFRTSVARTLLLALAVMVVSLSVFPQVGYAQTTLQQTGVVLVPPSSIKKGTPLDCIYDYVRQGVPPQQAINWCDFTDSSLEVPDGGDLSSYLGGIGGSSPGTTVGSVTCLNGEINSQISAKPSLKPLTTDSDTPPGDPNLPKSSDGATLFPAVPKYEKRQKNAEEAWQKYYEISKMFKQTIENGHGPSEHLRDTLDQARKDAHEAVEERDEYSKDLFEPSLWDIIFGSNDGSLGDYPTGDDGTAAAQTDPNTEDPCQGANQFISECNAADWQPEPCQLFRDKLEDPNCDPMTTDPMPGEEACGGESQPDPEEVERVVTLLCSMEINPSDPDQDPCAPFEMDAEVLRGDVPDQGDPCGSLVATTTEDQCVPSGTDPKVIYMKFREEDLAEATKKLGGPGIIIPMPQQNPPCRDCPQPETGGAGLRGG